MTDLGDYIKVWLERENTTQVWLADQSGIRRSTLNGIVTQGVKKPGIDSLELLAVAMNVPKQRLLVLAGYNKPEDFEQTGLTEAQEDVLELWSRIPEEYRPLMRDLLEQAAHYKAPEPGSYLGVEADEMTPAEVEQMKRFIKIRDAIVKRREERAS